jgi:serine/threonine-protein kinase RsbW
MLAGTNKKLVIYSDKSELSKVEKFIKEIFEENNLKHTNYNRVLLCVSEAVINSIEHGNRNDRNKSVTIEAECYSHRIFVKVKDEGSGFNLEMVDDPTSSANVKKESGRGIHIIRSLSDSLKYNSIGNSVQLKIECK